MQLSLKGSMENWTSGKLKFWHYIRHFVPPQMGHNLRYFRQLGTDIGSLKYSLKIAHKVHARSGSKAKQKKGLGMVFEGDFFRVSCLLMLVYLFVI